MCHVVATTFVCVYFIYHYMQSSLYKQISFIVLITRNNKNFINFIFPWAFQIQCNFGSKDKPNIMPHDMQALLKSIKKKHRRQCRRKKRKKKVIQQYEYFPATKSTRLKVSRIGKTLSYNYVKRGCQCCFVAKKPHLDHSLCLLIYENTKHLNAAGEHCHDTMVSGFRYVLGGGLLEKMKLQIAQMQFLWIITCPNYVTTHQRGSRNGHVQWIGHV